MDEPTRRAWSRPELIVLVRSEPEEAVLDGCKYTNPSSGPGSYEAKCKTWSGATCGTFCNRTEFS